MLQPQRRDEQSAKDWFIENVIRMHPMMRGIWLGLIALHLTTYFGRGNYGVAHEIVMTVIQLVTDLIFVIALTKVRPIHSIFNVAKWIGRMAYTVAIILNIVALLILLS